MFRAAIDACSVVLEPLGVHLQKEFHALDGWKRPKHAMVGLTALQVGLVHVLGKEHGAIPLCATCQSPSKHPKLFALEQI